MGKPQTSQKKSRSKGLGITKTTGFKFDKTKGQHILINHGLIDTIVQRAGVKSTDRVLEIGPGTGNLTVKLLAKAQKVFAFEVDPRMVAELHKRVQGTPLFSKLEVHFGDAIKATDWPRFDVCVANLPYQISSPFVKRLIRLDQHYRAAVVMVQKEFADRLVAKPGEKLYSRLSANVQLHCKVDRLIKVSRKSFKPPPRVDSAVVRIEPRHPKPPVDFTQWNQLLRIAFQRKNRTLAANFNHKGVMAVLHQNYLNRHQPDQEVIASVDAMTEKVLGVLKEAGFAEKRAQKMDEDDFLRLLMALLSNSIVLA